MLLGGVCRAGGQRWVGGSGLSALPRPLSHGDSTWGLVAFCSVPLPVPLGGEAGRGPAGCAGSSDSQACPGLHPQQRGHRAREGILPLCPALLRPPPESCVQLWSPQHRTELELWERGRRRPQQ